MYHILVRTMLWHEWEVPTPEFEKSHGKEPDLFVMTAEIAKIKDKSKVFFRDLLLLDKDLNSSQALLQDYDQVCDTENEKLNWHVIQLTMDQIKILIDFFRILDKDKHKGVNNLIARIDYYDEENHILTEKSIAGSVDLADHLTFQDESQTWCVKYSPTYLFIKQPQQPKIKAADVLPATDSQKAIRKYVKTILLEAEFMK